MNGDFNTLKDYFRKWDLSRINQDEIFEDFYDKGALYNRRIYILLNSSLIFYNIIIYLLLKINGELISLMIK